MAGHKTWAIGEEVLAADFGPFVSDQIVAVFASAAARTSGWPTPPTGAVSYLTNTPGILWTFDGTAWQYVATGREVARAALATDLVITSLPWDIPALDISFPAIPSHTYRVDIALTTVANQRCDFFLNDPSVDRSTPLHNWYQPLSAAIGGAAILRGTHRITAKTGTVSLGLRAAAGAVTLYGAASKAESEIWVTDKGAT